VGKDRLEGNPEGVGVKREKGFHSVCGGKSPNNSTRNRLYDALRRKVYVV
jgi:hypothetical protein